MFNAKVNRRSLSLGFILSSAFLVGSVRAQNSVYVSAETGSDTNPCTQAAPCREITTALNLVADNGTVYVLGSGEFTGFTILKPVSVIGERGKSAATGRATIRPTTSTGRIVLRGLAIKGIAASAPVGTLIVEDCVVDATNPFRITSPGYYLVRNSDFRPSPDLANNDGVWVERSPSYPGGHYGQIRAVFDNCTFQGGQYGLMIYGGYSETDYPTIVTVRNSTIAHTAYGIYLFSGGSTRGANLMLEDSLISSCGYDGVHIYGSGARLRIGRTEIDSCWGYAIKTLSSGYAGSYGNNRFSNNASGNVSGTFSTIAEQ